MNSVALDASALAGALAARAGDGRPVTEVFLVACGGSLVDLYGARYLLASESRRLRADSWTANEFVHATPAALGAQSLVLICTHSGGTAEAVQAAVLAQAAGAFVVTLTNNAAARISAHSDHNIFYQWGDDSRVSDNPMATALSLAAEILRHSDGWSDYDDFREALGMIDAVAVGARDNMGDRARAFAARNRAETLFYILSSGPSFGHAQGFAGCSLMEMQWLNASAIHSGEFFHGPFEITDDSSNFIVLVNEGRTRALDQRVVAFLQRHASNYELIDARELGISTLPGSVAEHFNPVLFYSVITRYREALAAVRGHPLEQRRYMGRVEY